MSTESADKPRPPRSLVEAIVGEQNTRFQEKVNALTERVAESNARHARIRNVIGTVFFVLLIFSMVFGLSMGCLALWNTVVG